MSLKLKLALLYVTIAVVILPPFCVTALAQTSSDTQTSSSSTVQSDDSLHITLGAFGWFPGVHGTVGAQGHNTSVHVSGTEVLSDLQFSLLGAFELRKKRFVAPMDFFWVNMATTQALPLNDVGQTSARVELNQSSFTPRFGYRLVNTDLWKIDALAGIRYWHLGQTVTLRPSGDSRSQSGNWVDGLGGASIELAVGPKAFIRVLGDAGAGGANLDYQAVGWFGVRVSKMLGIIAGWRYMDVDYRGNDQFIYDVAQSGPLVGLTLNLGGKPAPPPVASCSLSPREVLPGEPVTAHIRTQNFNPKHTISYAWSGSGLQVSSTTDAATVETTNLAPGNYSLTATATDSKLKKNNVASCSGTFIVNEPPKHPPTAACSANPGTVKAGDIAAIAVTANSPDGRPLTYSYATTAGQISGSGANVNLDTTMATPGSTITATATVSDDRGLTVSCTADVAVLAPPVVVKEASEVGECKFMNAKKPWRVDNECKAILDTAALRIQREPNGKLYVVGYEEEEEVIDVKQLGEQRAVNIKKYLTEGEGKAGIDTASVVPVKGKTHSKTGKIYFVPEGATLTAEETETFDETMIKSPTGNLVRKGSKKQ